jgi:hypothetical protein
MPVFRFPKEEVLNKMRSRIDAEGTVQEAEDAIENLRKIYYQIFLVPISDAGATPDLNYVYHYVKLRDAVETAVAQKETGLSIDEDTLSFLKVKFSAFAGWNLSLADMIMIVNNDLQGGKL